MNEEIKRILKMVEEGKLTSDQAAELISAIKESDRQSEPPKSGEKKLKVNIVSSKGKDFNINMPLKFCKGILKATGKIPMHIEGGEEKDMQVIMAAIENEVCGKIVDMRSGNGDHIEVVIE